MRNPLSMHTKITNKLIIIKIWRYKRSIQAIGKINFSRDKITNAYDGKYVQAAEKLNSEYQLIVRREYLHLHILKYKGTKYVFQRHENLVETETQIQC